MEVWAAGHPTREALRQRMLGLLLTLFSLAMVPPALISWWYDDNALRAFVFAFLVIAGGGLALWFPVRRHRRELLPAHLVGGCVRLARADPLAARVDDEALEAAQLGRVRR